MFPPEMRAFVPMLVALLAACGPDARPTDAGLDAAPSDAPGSRDASIDASADAGPRSCADAVRSGPWFPLDPDGPATEIHAAVAFDGERIRVAFARPDAAGTFDVWLTTVGCDGTLGTPERVSTTDANEVDPDIAIAADAESFLVWTQDDGEGGTDNMHVFSRLVPGPAPDTEIRTSRAGAPVPDNHLAYALVADGAGFLLAGVRALATTDRFHVFVQSLASDGSLAGEAWEPTLLPELGHAAPAVAPAEGGAYVAFEREEEFATRVWLARNGSGADAELALDSPAITSTPHLAADRVDPSIVYLAVTGEVIAGSPDVFLAVASEPSATRTRLQLGASGRLDYGPRIVAHPDGGGVVSYVRTEGAESRILAQRFSLAAGELAAGPEVEVAPSIAPYPLTATHVAGDVFFAAWSERSTGELRLAGRFVEIPR